MLFRDGGLVPDLLGDQSDSDREALQRPQVRDGVAAGRQLIVPALSRQQRPQPPDTPSFE
jgi:hypothetical protein